MIPKHPFPMETVFQNCYLVNFAMEPSLLQRLLPHPIQPDVRNGEAFLSVVVSELADMRPTFIPKGFGFNFNQIVYRAIVTCNNERGVHFLRSDANNRFMCLTGNLFSFFHFNYARINTALENGHHRINVATKNREADIIANYDLSKLNKEMPKYSVFSSLDDAKEFFVELYVAFSTIGDFSTAVRIKRTNWDLSVVHDENAIYSFMDGSQMFPKGSTRLDSVFYVKNLFYHWHTLEKTKLYR